MYHNANNMLSSNCRCVVAKNAMLEDPNKEENWVYLAAYPCIKHAEHSLCQLCKGTWQNLPSVDKGQRECCQEAQQSAQSHRNACIVTCITSTAYWPCTCMALLWPSCELLDQGCHVCCPRKWQLQASKASRSTGYGTDCTPGQLHQIASLGLQCLRIALQ